MKTIEINLYKFSELSETAKQKAINSYRQTQGVDFQFIYDEAYQTVKKFNEIFGLKEGSRSWLDFSHSFNDDIYELKGLRLRKYIINNFGGYLQKGRYFSLWSKTDKNPNYRKQGSAPWGKLKSRHSKTIFNRDCVLTGVYYDNYILQPIYNLIDWDKPDYQSYNDIENLFNECFQEIENAINSEIEQMQSDDHIEEMLSINEYDFTENGEIY